MAIMTAVTAVLIYHSAIDTGAQFSVVFTG